MCVASSGQCTEASGVSQTQTLVYSDNIESSVLIWAALHHHHPSLPIIKIVPVTNPLQAEFTVTLRMFIKLCYSIMSIMYLILISCSLAIYPYYKRSLYLILPYSQVLSGFYTAIHNSMLLSHGGSLPKPEMVNSGFWHLLGVCHWFDHAVKNLSIFLIVLFLKNIIESLFILKRKVFLTPRNMKI